MPNWRRDRAAMLAATVIAGACLCPARCVSAAPAGFAKTCVSRIADPSWIKRKTLKNWFVLTVCVTNSVRMSMKADTFTGRDGGDGYRAKTALFITGCAVSGWLFYAVVDNDGWTWGEKTRLVGGALSISRECGEFFYQGGRYGAGDFLNNDPEKHANELPWFSTKGSFPYLREEMIPTGRITTPVAHIVFSVLGSKLTGEVE